MSDEKKSKDVEKPGDESKKALPQSIDTKKTAVADTLPVEPKHGSTKISLKVYLLQSGIRADQAAGFKTHCRLAGIVSNTVAQWQKLHDTFNKRPV